ncbi:SsgA family sporulation/cell division regulator [Streptomyces winkii]|uniref:SsgA family sporulation/cell division regulator n=1 Tax=Streptomyces winkii TaxID=3051178 RepID=UPI0028D4DEF5|nr:SsgA family sporulation/cell division regulator [Streptomyces sp. DSM 40971]
MITPGEEPHDKTPAGSADGPQAVGVEDELELFLRLSSEVSVPITARFAYCTNDPYAVDVVFDLGMHEPVRWIFARELLAAGMDGPTGEGDVLVWPVRERAVCCLSLASREGHALVEMPSGILARWLKRTHRLVPPGREAQFVDVDALSRYLLHGAGPDG